MGPFGNQKSFGEAFHVLNFCHFQKQGTYQLVRADSGFSGMDELEQFRGDAEKRCDNNSRNNFRLSARQDFQLAFERKGERIGKSRKQDASIRGFAGEPTSAMDRNHSLARASGPRHSCRARKGLFDDGPLGRMQKYNPALPWVRKGLLQFLGILDNPNAAERVRMRVGIGNSDWRPNC